MNKKDLKLLISISTTVYYNIVMYQSLQQEYLQRDLIMKSLMKLIIRKKQFKIWETVF